MPRCSHVSSRSQPSSAHRLPRARSRTATGCASTARPAWWTSSKKGGSMQPFDYARPGTLSEALALVSRHGSDACLLAGGTDVVVGLRNRSLKPKVVIDLKHVAELRPAI